MPYMMVGRNESAIYYEKDVDIENALHFVKEKNDRIPAEADEDERYSLFALVLAAILRTIALRPQLNRFIHGRALYQRNHVSFSFIVKQKLQDEAPEGSAKVFLEPQETIESVTKKVNLAISHVRRYGEGGDGEKIAKFAHAVPGGKALVIGLYRILDRLNLAPWALLKTDPLYSSVYIANLGSIGLDAPFHHLYEWGNASFFVVMGKLQQKEGRGVHAATKRHHVNFKVTLDERIADGLYFARSASIFTRLLAKPELLELPLDEAREQLAP
jgi:hypothetical protein